MKSAIILTTLISLAVSAPTNIRIIPSDFDLSTRQAGGNLQTFTGALGGIAATPVENSGDAKRPFSVKGDTFVNIGAALQRSCDQQFNACANSANGGNKAISVADCSAQKDQCTAADKNVKAPAQVGNANGNANAGASGAATGNATAAASSGNAASNGCAAN